MLEILIAVFIVIMLYFWAISPRLMHRPDTSILHGVHYAHRGLFDNKSEAPENSLAAFHKAVEAGYGIEMDVQLTKDDIPIVFHDATLKRMCGVDGYVWDYTLEELQKMRLADSDETIPTFQDVLKEVNGQVPLIIEYKLDRPTTRVCELAHKQLARYKGIYCIESFHPYALRWYKIHHPEIIRGQLSENFWREEEYKGKILYFLLGNLMLNFLGRPDFIAYCHLDAKNLSRRLCKMMGALSVTWTIRSQEEYLKAKKYFKLFIFDSFILK